VLVKVGVGGVPVPVGEAVAVSLAVGDVVLDGVPPGVDVSVGVEVDIIVGVVVAVAVLVVTGVGVSVIGSVGVAVTVSVSNRVWLISKELFEENVILFNGLRI
jgi:hypothetical protein